MSELNELKREYVFSTYVVSKYNKSKDALFVKEILHKPDGTKERIFRRIDNYQIPFYVTKKEFRDHEQKKEFEYNNKLTEHICNKASLPNKAYQALNGSKPYGYVKLNDVTKSPYLYGTDITPSVFLYKEYLSRYPNLSSPYSLAMLDYETDMVNGTEQIISGALAFGNKVHIVITKGFIPNETKESIDLKVRKTIDKYLSELVTSRKLEIKIDVLDTPGKCVIELMRSAHEWKPDFIGIWNIEFDVDKMIMALELDNVDPALVFSDPSVSAEFKYFKWKKDFPYKIKANGEKVKKHISERWHNVITPASFQFICSMASFRHIRDREQKRTSYALDPILHEFLNFGKFKGDFLPDNIKGGEWHRQMQKRFKFEYIAYMLVDVIGPLMLDEKTKDLSNSIKGCMGISELTKVKSNPRRLVDDCYFFSIAKNKILASTSEDMTTPLDSYVPSLKNWVITLPAELTHASVGLKLINEYPCLSTNISLHNFDVDVKSAYPFSEICLNAGMSTASYVLCKIDGYTENKQRSIGLNLTNVKGNALSLARDCYGYPELNQMLTRFKFVNNLNEQ